MKQKAISVFIASLLGVTVIVTPIADLLPGENSVEVQAKSKKVYYVPGSSYAYHSSKSCRALARSKGIRKISIKQAKAKGLKKCKIKGCW